MCFSISGLKVSVVALELTRPRALENVGPWCVRRQSRRSRPARRQQPRLAAANTEVAEHRGNEAGHRPGARRIRLLGPLVSHQVAGRASIGLALQEPVQVVRQRASATGVAFWPGSFSRHLRQNHLQVVGARRGAPAGAAGTGLGIWRGLFANRLGRRGALCRADARSALVKYRAEGVDIDRRPETPGPKLACSGAM